MALSVISLDFRGFGFETELFSRRWCVEDTRGVATIFQRAGHTVSKQGLFNYGQDIVMAFSPPVVGCLVKKACKKGGHELPRTPLATPLEDTIQTRELTEVRRRMTESFLKGGHLRFYCSDKGDYGMHTRASNLVLIRGVNFPVK